MASQPRRSMGGTGVGRFQKIERSKELATERATEKRKEEGRALFEYEQLLKTMGMKASKEFEKRKAAYAAKLQGEKDHKFKRQATKRKRREAEEAAKAGEEEEESGEEGAEGSKAKKARVDTSNPFFKEQSAFEEKQKAKEEEKRKQEEEKAEKEKAIKESNRRRKTVHLKLQEKTRRGQPIMANKMNYLMTKITKSLASK